MAHPYHHAVRSAKLFGGRPEDYLAVHNWFDESKAHFVDLRHRALRHHTEGIFLCERLLGVTVTNADGREVPTRLVGEQHVKDDLGWVPTVKDWLVNLRLEPWMTRTPFRPSRDQAAADSLGPEAPAPLHSPPPADPSCPVQGNGGGGEGALDSCPSAGGCSPGPE
jgi:hypothetical protein